MRTENLGEGRLESHDRVLYEGVEAWNAWRQEKPATIPRLRGARLAGVDLRGADLRRTDLREADLTAADLRGADLRGADLRGANLQSADLRGTYASGVDLRESDLRQADLRRVDLAVADLSGADLRGADLRGADLRHADLRRAVLERVLLDDAELWDAILGWTIFGDIDLSRVRNLDMAIHLGPSTVGVDVICQSRGKLPKVFLQRAGVPEGLIAELLSLAQNGAASGCCLVAFAEEDEELAYRIWADLHQNGLRCWLAPGNVELDDRIRQSIDSTIRLHDKLLLLLSQHSIASEWIDDVVRTALDEEQIRQEPMLFALRLDDAVPEETTRPCAKLVSDGRPLADFVNWDMPEVYDQAAQQLMDLLGLDSRA